MAFRRHRPSAISQSRQFVNQGLLAVLGGRSRLTLFNHQGEAVRLFFPGISIETLHPRWKDGGNRDPLRGTHVLPDAYRHALFRYR